MNYQQIQVFNQNLMGYSVLHDYRHFWPVPSTAFNQSTYAMYEQNPNRLINTNEWNRKLDMTKTQQSEQCEKTWYRKPYLQSINSHFACLRNHIPNKPHHIKLTKINTLKLAIEYIQHLTDLLDNEETERADEDFQAGAFF